jgi:hypothetical protein
VSVLSNDSAVAEPFRTRGVVVAADILIDSARSPSTSTQTTSSGLDDAGRAQLGFARGFLESSNVRGLIYGNTFEKLRA